MRESICGMMLLVAVTGWALSVAAQVEKSQAATSSASQQPREKTPPYTAEYKNTEISTCADGKTITHVWKKIESVDSEGRRLTADTFGNWIDKGEPVMRYHVYDPVAWTNTYWSVPGLHEATEEKKLPDGTDRLPCPETVTPEQRAQIDAQIKARLDALKAKREASKQALAVAKGSVPESPAPVQPVPPTAPPPQASQFINEDLGIKTILGFEAQGRRIGNSGSPGSIHEIWLTSAPGMRGIKVRSSTEILGSNSISSKITEELVKLTLGEPGMSFFQPPGNYEIVKKEEERTECVNLQKMLKSLPPATPPAQ
jgi:hypothetical protein